MERITPFLITASNVGQIVHLRDTTDPMNTVKQIRAYVDIPQTLPMVYGQKSEAKARQTYIKQHAKVCNEVVQLSVPGLIISPELPFLAIGASLDGLIVCKKCGTGGLEIKCPWSLR